MHFNFVSRKSEFSEHFSALMSALKTFCVHFSDVASNVEYVEINIPADFPLPWRRFLPNVFYSGAMATEDDERYLKKKT